MAKARLTFLFCLLAAIASPARADSPSPAFEEANQFYTQGKFAEAKAAYQKAEAQAGGLTANLEYNLGNTEFRLSAPGRAALAYERALFLEPQFPEARANLSFVRGQTGAKLVSESSLDRLVLPWSPNAYVICATVAVWLAVFLVAGMLLYGWFESLAAWSGLFCALAIGAYSGFALSQDGARRSLAVVVEKEATARLEAFDRSGVSEVLSAGSRVRVLSERGPWIYCELPGDRRGWLPAATLEKLIPASS
jgi:tetratricopeptide (TPR) repeat protein